MIRLRDISLFLNKIKYCLTKNCVLWQLNLFSSSFEACQAINFGNVLLNNKSIKANVFLKKGDIKKQKSDKNLAMAAFRDSLERLEFSKNLLQKEKPRFVWRFEISSEGIPMTTSGLNFFK